MLRLRVAIVLRRVYIVLMRDQLIIGEQECTYQDIALLVHDFLAEQCCEVRDLSEFIVCAGPGSFTASRALFSFALGVRAACEHISVRACTLFSLLELCVIDSIDASSEQSSTIFLLESEATFSQTPACYVYRKDAQSSSTQTMWLSEAVAFANTSTVIASFECDMNGATSFTVIKDYYKALKNESLQTTDEITPLYLPIRPDSKF